MSNLARVTGTVLSQPEPFRGRSKATNEPFAIHSVKVLVADSDVTTINFNRDDEGYVRGLKDVLRFEKEQPVDFLVEVGTYRGEPQFNLVRKWEPTPDELAAVLEAHTSDALV